MIEDAFKDLMDKDSERDKFRKSMQMSGKKDLG